jgi:hypothetical protein
MMEYFDVFTAFFTGITLGLIAGSYLKRAERRIEFARGELAATNRYWWAILFAYGELEHRERSDQQPANSERDNGQGGAG